MKHGIEGHSYTPNRWRSVAMHCVVLLALFGCGEGNSGQQAGLQQPAAPGTEAAAQPLQGRSGEQSADRTPIWRTVDVAWLALPIEAYQVTDPERVGWQRLVPGPSVCWKVGSTWLWDGVVPWTPSPQAVRTPLSSAEVVSLFGRLLEAWPTKGISHSEVSDFYNLFGLAMYCVQHEPVRFKECAPPLAKLGPDSPTALNFLCRIGATAAAQLYMKAIQPDLLRASLHLLSYFASVSFMASVLQIGSPDACADVLLETQLGKIVLRDLTTPYYDPVPDVQALIERGVDLRRYLVLDLPVHINIDFGIRYLTIWTVADLVWEAYRRAYPQLGWGESHSLSSLDWDERRERILGMLGGDLPHARGSKSPGDSDESQEDD